MISVIIPAYNREQKISRSVLSVLNQSHRDFELIIVDDASTDNTIDIVNSIEDSRIKIIKSDINNGAAAARNKGILNAKGEIIAFLDSDDFYEPEMLSEVLRTLGNTPDEIGFMWSGVRYLTEKETRNGLWEPVFSANTYQTFLNSLHIGTNSGIAIKAGVFKKCGLFNETLPAAEDTDYFLRISKEYRYCFSKKILINIDKRDGDRLSKNYKKIALAYNIFLPDHFDAINQSRHLKKKYYYKMMWLNYHLNDKEKARKYLKILIQEGIFSLKILFVSTVFELLPNSLASGIHKRLAH